MAPDFASRVGWSSPKLEARESPQTGRGMFARVPVARDEILAIWGGYVLTTDERHRLPEAIERYTVQIEADYHLASGLTSTNADFFNHSCHPNAGLRGQIVLVAMRDIQPGEEVCFDYAMSEADPTLTMECACGQSDCRKRITGDDWKLPTLQARYKGYFSPYIQRTIDQLEAAK